MPFHVRQEYGNVGDDEVGPNPPKRVSLEEHVSSASTLAAIITSAGEALNDISISSLPNVIDLARQWFSHIRAASREDVEKYQRALEPFYTALNETKIFIGSVKELGRDREREEQLSRLWNEASIHLLPYNTDLAARCHFKADYWANPPAWSDKKLKKARIEIGRVAKEAQRLLAKKGP